MSNSSSYNSIVVGAISALTGAAVAAGVLAFLDRKKKTQENIYETKRSLSEYLLFHFGSADQLLNWSFGPKEAVSFPADLAREAIAFQRKRGADESMMKRALDIGCAVGRTSFELSAAFDSVVGIDYSHSFVNAAKTLAGGHTLPYDRYDEGDLKTMLVARAPAEARLERVRFEQGDACNLRADLCSDAEGGAFDLVLAANLVDRLPDPRAFLERVPSLLKSGGVLMLTTPFTWMEQFTPKSKWLGGYYDAATGKPVHSFDTLKQILESTGFELVEVKDMPFFIREHNRKNQWSVSKASFWVKL